MYSFEVHSNESACRNVDVLGWTKSVLTAYILPQNTYQDTIYAPLSVSGQVGGN